MAPNEVMHLRVSGDLNWAEAFVVVGSVYCICIASLVAYWMRLKAGGEG